MENDGKFKFKYVHIGQMDFPGGASDKESACQCRRHKRRGFAPSVGKIPWRRKWKPTLVPLPGKSHGWRSLVGYNPWGRKESDTAERLHIHFHPEPGFLEAEASEAVNLL